MVERVTALADLVAFADRMHFGTSKSSTAEYEALLRVEKNLRLVVCNVCEYRIDSTVGHPTNEEECGVCRPMRETLAALDAARKPVGLMTTPDRDDVTPAGPAREFTPDVSDVERLLRQEWWMNHGCPPGSAYGDDGEMSCGVCGLDFKRMELPALYSHVVRARQMAGAKAWEALNG